MHWETEDIHLDFKEEIKIKCLCLLKNMMTIFKDST